MTPRLYHGGVPGLKVGDLLEGGNERRYKNGCVMCEQKARGEGPDATQHPHEVYCTTDREYARLHASIYGYGDLYRVELIEGEPVARSDEDDIETYRSPRLRVAGIVDRAVRLTWKQRDRFWRRANTTPPAGGRAELPPSVDLSRPAWEPTSEPDHD